MRPKSMLFMRAIHQVAPTILILCFLIAGCASLPAEIPPQIDDTPGPFVVVQDDTLKTDAYWVDPPAGWKIVKSSIAADPIVIVFASPEDDMIITVSESPLPEATSESETIYQQKDVSLPNGQTVYLSGEAPDDAEEAFQEAFAAVYESIRLPQ